jgi:hypothetical protein
LILQGFSSSVEGLQFEVCSGSIDYKLRPATRQRWTFWGLNPGTPTALAFPLLDDGYAGPIFSAALSSASVVATFSFRSRRFLASMSLLQYSLENQIDHM